MYICPWCGTAYASFQSNCRNCGGTLEEIKEKNDAVNLREILPEPPSPPRNISDRYIWRLLSTDGGVIISYVFGLIGIIFSLVGTILTIAIITIYVGLPLLLIGLIFIGIGIWIFIARYQMEQKVVRVLREGNSIHGIVIGLQENYSVVINGRHPWKIKYKYQVNGKEFEGKITTLNQPGPQLKEGREVNILYLSEAPESSSIYPHP